MAEQPVQFDVVIPTIGRPSLVTLLEALAAARGPRPAQLIVVDDRRSQDTPLVPKGTALDALPCQVVRGRAAGPAAARNTGWGAAGSHWVAFLDDDVVPGADWFETLAADLFELHESVAASQGHIVVPLPTARRPTDWERNVQALELAQWATADMAYRRAVLQQLGGFDERFPRAFREDADLALRALSAGYRIVRGQRRVVHPVGPAGRWVSVRLQAGNADDALMRQLHGRDWHRRAGAEKGSRQMHLLTSAFAGVTLAAALAHRPRLSLLALSGWAASTGAFAGSRIAPGPRTPDEIQTMLLTSAVIPFAASLHWLSGRWRWRRARPWHPGRPDAVLFDRDGTLVVDVPYNGDPQKVRPMAGAKEAVRRLRKAGIPTGVVSNQSGVARGRVTMRQVHAVNRRVEALLGPLGPFLVCPHLPSDGCPCRKPLPGLILQAARRLGVPPERVAVVGDIGADMAAARAAGARAILVPTLKTRPEEVADAPEVARDLDEAVDRLIS
jgi:histidinol-phosphate phosphatase family protein